MDFLRFTYKTRMRFAEGQDAPEVQWFRARPAAKPLPFPHRFGSRVWESNWRTDVDQGQFGELYGLKPKWVEPEFDANTCLEGPYWPDKFRPGVPSTEANTFPALRKDAQGVFTGCCVPAQFVPFFDCCDVLPRITKRIRVTFSSGTGGGCPQADGTDLIMIREEDGVWRATGTFGPGGPAIQLVFPFYPTPLSSCNLQVLFTDHVPSQSWIRLNQIEEPHFEFFTNPLLIRNLLVTTNHVQPGFFPCGPSVLIPGWATSIRALPDEAE